MTPTTPREATAMPSDPVRLEVEGPRARLVLHRPEKLNALNAAVLDGLDDALDILEAHDEARVVTVEGAGERAFCVGADVRELTARRPEHVGRSNLRGHEVFDRLERLRLPTVALLHGFTLGGGLELAMACDLRLAVSGTQLGLPEVSIGVIPGWGGTWRLSRLVGETKARELILTARRIDAHEAQRIGLVNEVVPDDGLEQHADVLTAEIAENSPAAVAIAKETLGTWARIDATVGRVESAANGHLVSLDDFQQRVSARLG